MASSVTRPRLPAGTETVVVFGGSFDPPHRYHVTVPLQVARENFGEKACVLYVPAARSPFKARGPVATDSQRLAMLRHALRAHRRCVIWKDELDRARCARDSGRSGVSFTIDTLKRLRSTLPSEVCLRLLIGADQATEFHRWKDCREIIEVAEPLVMARPPIRTARALVKAMDQRYWSRAEQKEWGERLVKSPIMRTSSTAIRAAIPVSPPTLRAWAQSEALREVPQAVARFIIAKRLYKATKPLTSQAS